MIILTSDAATAAGTSTRTINRLSDEGFFAIENNGIVLSQDVQQLLDEIRDTDYDESLHEWTPIQLSACPVRKLANIVRRQGIASGSNLRALKREDLISLIYGEETDETRAQGITLNKTPSSGDSANLSADFVHFDLSSPADLTAHQTTSLDTDDEQDEPDAPDFFDGADNEVQLDLDELGWNDTDAVGLIVCLSIQTLNHHLEEHIEDELINISLLESAKLVVEEAARMKKLIRKYRRMIKRSL